MKLRFGLFDFDAAAGELRRDGDFVKLPPQPARLLASLLRRAGEVVTRDELRRELWGADTFVDFERSLNFCVQQVRAALGDSSDNPRFIQTVPRRGYRFIAPVSIVTAHEHPAPLKPPSSPLAFPVPRRHLWLAVPATTLIVLLLAAWLIPFNIAAPRHTPAPASRPTRVVVLPFANLTGDESASYLADGLTDELIARLGAMGGDALAVIARTSAMTYRNTSKTITDIGKELDVAFVVEGSVRRDAGGLRISGSLVPVQQQTAIARWDESFDSGEGGADARNTFAAIRLARLVAIRLLPSAKVSAPQTTADPDAWDALLQANAAIERGTADDARRAVSSLEHAVTVDPGFAGAWAQLAQVKHLLVMMGVERPADAYARAQEAADSAVRLDPQLASAHIAHGLVALWYDWQPARAARDFERALSLNASDAAAHHDYAWSLVALDRADEAVRHMLTARDLDPLSTRANNDIGWLHLQLRQPADAARACEHTLAMDGSSLEAQACLERAYAGRQLYDAALAAARTATPPDATFSGARHSTTAADTLRQLWRWRLDRLQHASESRWINPYTLAVQYALVGDTARALDALESAYDERVGMLVFLKRDPAFDTLRQESRFDELIRRVSEKAF